MDLETCSVSCPTSFLSEESEMLLAEFKSSLRSVGDLGCSTSSSLTSRRVDCGTCLPLSEAIWSDTFDGLSYSSEPMELFI